MIKKSFTLLLSVILVINTPLNFVYASTLYLHQDHQGSTILVTDENGSVVGKKGYYPYGEVSDETGDTDVERLYTSQVSDADQTGLYYYNQRYYNPTLSKFIQPDPIKDGLNGYAYVSNNPINLIDPGGLYMENPFHQDYFTHAGIIWEPPVDKFVQEEPPIIPPIFENNLLEDIGLTIHSNQDETDISLTLWGNNAKDLYVLYKDTPGWWNEYGETSFTPEDFMNLILSYEFGTLSKMSEHQRFKNDLAESSTRWFYSKCEYEKGSTCKTSSPNAIFNWVGGALESFQRRWRAVFLDNQGWYKKFNANVLNNVTKNEGRAVDLANFVTSSIVLPPDSFWKVTSGNEISNKPFYWGNETMFSSPPTKYLWKFGSGSTAWYLVSPSQIK